MSLRLYMDVHVPRAVTDGLRLREVDVLTAQQDGHERADDSTLLDRATALNRVLFSQDEDLLTEAADHLNRNREFAGIVFVRQMKTTIGQCVRDLEFVALVLDPSDMHNRVLYLPLDR